LHIFVILVNKASVSITTYSTKAFTFSPIVIQLLYYTSKNNFYYFVCNSSK